MSRIDTQHVYYWVIWRPPKGAPGPRDPHGSLIKVYWTCIHFQCWKLRKLIPNNVGPTCLISLCHLRRNVPLWSNVPFFEECTIFGAMSHRWRYLPFFEKCAIFGAMYHLRRNVPFMEECAIFGEMCHFWRNVTFLEQCAIFGAMCYFWSNVPF